MLPGVVRASYLISISLLANPLSYSFDEVRLTNDFVPSETIAEGHLHRYLQRHMEPDSSSFPVVLPCSSISLNRGRYNNVIMTR